VKGITVVDYTVILPCAIIFYLLLLKKIDVISFRDLSLFRQEAS